MTNRIEFAPAAAEEARQASDHYQRISPSLGLRFRAALAEACEGVAERPLAWPLVSARLRRRVLRGFPYSLFFRVAGEVVTVVAVAHHRRHPAGWQRRE